MCINDDIIISMALLIASTLYQNRQVNDRSARKQTTDQNSSATEREIAGK